MRLIDWMRREHLDDEGFATRMNDGLPIDDHCTAVAVKKWKYRERQPPTARVARIEQVTNGEVALRDWVNLTPLMAPNEPDSPPAKVS